MKNSILSKIILVQVACIIAGVMTICGFLYESSSRNEREALLKLKQIVQTKISPDQEMIRAWSALGLEKAIDEKFQSFQQMLPIKDVQIINGENHIQVNQYQFLIPEKVDDGVPSQILVTIDSRSLPASPTRNSEIFLILIALAGVLVGGMLYSTSILKKQIYSPLSRLFQGFENLQNGQKVDISTIDAQGEIAAFINGIVTMHNKILHLEASSAVAQTTQMLAHDVRKPFTMLKVVIDMIATSPASQAKKTAEDFLPEVKKSLASVNGMIADVMEVGSLAPPNRENISIETVLESALNENLRYNNQANIDISYQFNHKRLLHADTLKVTRAVSNIVGNAVQAMQNRGRIWIKTSELDNMMQITIGNSNSFISELDRRKLFESFFTKDKKGGTGLGLAIARKVVVAHQGDIWCTSHRENGTEFHFTLPLSSESAIRRQLPTSSQAIHEHFKDVTTQNDPPLGNGIEEKVLASLQETVTLLICDDESLYRNHIQSYILDHATLKQKVNVIAVDTVEKALAAFKLHSPNVVIMDIDLESGGNGFDAVRKIRKLSGEAKICIHSNRSDLDSNKRAIEAGADFFLPKPMTRAHLLSIILESTPSSTHSSEPNRTHLVLVDDCRIQRYHWSHLKNLKEEVKVFESPEDFFKAVQNDPLILAEAKGIITDQYFEGASDYSGLEFAEILRGMGFDRNLYLCSDGEFNEDSFKSTGIKKIPKIASAAVSYL